MGETLGNQKLANQGVADQVKGAAKETWGNVKDAARDTNARANDRDNEQANKDLEQKPAGARK